MTIITKVPESVPGDASATLIRPKFSAGLLLQDDDLTQAVDYLRGVTRMLFRSMLGCGVLCGFEVTPSLVCNDHHLSIDIAKGVALDCNGDLIELPEATNIEYRQPCIQGAAELPKEVWIVICHSEKDCSPRDTLCSTQDGELSPVYTRTREGYELKVIEVKNSEPPPNCCACVSTYGKKATSPGASTCCNYIAIPADDNCYSHHYQGDCACDCQCDCIVLARVLLVKGREDQGWQAEADHSVRRYIRPVLMRDPLSSPVNGAAADSATPKPATASAKKKNN